MKAWTPLAILELSKENIPCCCQSHVDCLVTQTIGSMLTDGRQGFVGDVLNDWSFAPIGDRPQNVIVIGHCGAPITPLPNRRIPYLIRDHIHSDKEWFGPDDIPTATTVSWPADEPATVVKFDVGRQKVSCFRAKVRDGDTLYEDFANCICRNKMVVQIDHPRQLLPAAVGPEGRRVSQLVGQLGMSSGGLLRRLDRTLAGIRNRCRLRSRGRQVTRGSPTAWTSAGG